MQLSSGKNFSFDVVGVKSKLLMCRLLPCVYFLISEVPPGSQGKTMTTLLVVLVLVVLILEKLISKILILVQY
jgi:hypothetical protein